MPQRKKQRSLLSRLGQTLSSVTDRLGGDGRRWGPPLGCYRGVLTEGVNMVLPGQQTRRADDASVRHLARLNQDRRQPWPIFWKRIPNARLVSMSLAELRSDKRVMSESVFDLYMSSAGDPALDYFRLPSPVKLVGPWTSLVSRWCSSKHYHYFHWMTDGLPRLAVLDRFPQSTQILIPSPLRSFHRETLEMMGLLDRCRVTPEWHVEIEDYYFSSPTAMTGCENPYANAFLREKFLPHAAPLSAYPEKIYITRQNGTRSPLNEARLIDFLREEGWTIVAAENHPVADQIALLSKARQVCGVHGGGLTNLLWCQPGTRVLEILAENYLNGCYEGLASSLGLDHRYRVFPANADSRINVPFDDFVKAIRSLEETT